MSDIEWTSKTWNPIVGCTRVSPGCEHCYAERFVHRGMAPQHRGLTVLGKGEKGPRWTGEVRLVESALAKPLSWRKPQRVFVNSLSDLFHDSLKLDDVARIFAVMAEATRHTFQILTKRPKRMHGLLSSDAFWAQVDAAWCELFAADRTSDHHDIIANDLSRHFLDSVWLGVTAEDQQRADERIPLLLDTPSAVRFVSYEPALGPVDFGRWMGLKCTHEDAYTESDTNATICKHCDDATHLDWLIVGGESGPGARPFDLAWARSAVEQCKAASVPVFVKQLGTFPVVGPYRDPPTRVKLAHGKGADPSEWPADLCVREFPR